MKRRIISIAILIILLSSLTISAIAANGIQPRLNNVAMTSTNFTISTSGNATITASYTGYHGITNSATVTSYIEKRTLGIFWTKVDIGQSNNEWVDYSTEHTGVFVHTVQLDNTGTYRAIVTYEISGTGGATDVIDYEQERTYS